MRSNRFRIAVRKFGPFETAIHPARAVAILASSPSMSGQHSGTKADS